MSSFGRNVGITTLFATAATLVGIALVARREKVGPFRAVNSISHILHGDEVEPSEGFAAVETLPAVAMNTAAMAGWAMIAEALMTPKSDNSTNVARAAATGAVVSGLAYLVDYHIVPKRWTPGIERYFSKAAIGAVYGFLATGIAAGALIRRR